MELDDEHEASSPRSSDNDAIMFSDDDSSEDLYERSVKAGDLPQKTPTPDPDHDNDDTASIHRSDSEVAAKLAAIEIGLPLVAPDLLDEFEIIQSSTIERIIDQSGSGLDAIYTVEFSDGREDVIKHINLLSYENADDALLEFMDDTHYRPLSQKRRRTDLFDDTSDDDGAASTTSANSSSSSSFPDSLTTRPSRLRQQATHTNSVSSDASHGQRTLRKRERKSVNLTKLSQASIGLITRSEGSDLESQDEDEFRPVMSDFALPGRPRKGTFKRKPHRLLRRANVAPGVRRSDRTTKSTVGMYEDDDFDDILYNEQAARPPGAPKIHSIKEVFEYIDANSEFGTVHASRCVTCGHSGRRGQLVYCQGCTITMHKHCLGPRSARDHLVTKVGTEQFLLQCKHCIGAYTKNDKKAPSYSRCQHCKANGQACTPFSKRQTAKQEEKLRLENDGIDPITTVSESLINNAENVLFRCGGCHRAWHQNHLPALGQVGATDEITNGTIEDYMVDSTCNQCSAAPGKIHQIVAWRPSDTSIYTPTLVYADVSEDEKNYLIKWEDKSHFHCTWVSGSWLYGFVHGTMRAAFAKRAAAEPLCKASEKDAIPTDYLTADIIFAVKLAQSTGMPKTKSLALQSIDKVKRILVKFRGLSYDFVVWDTPPTEEMGYLYEAFQEAYNHYIEGQFFVNDASAVIKERLRKMRSGKPPQVKSQPSYIKGGSLMDYQVEGINWMLDNFHEGKSVILADEMGLGKTVQVISFIATLIHDTPKCYPFLVVVPNATCGNWRREFKQWAPDVRIVSYHGGKVSQEYAYKYELFPNGANDMKAHVVIMSYDSAQDPATLSKFNRIQWTGLVVDEGQRLKNDENRLYTALSAVKIPFQLLLTGTPLQNNKRELFNLLQFIDKTQNATKLDEEYAVLTKENLPQLHEKIRPYFLRRTKTGVLTFLPPMRQIIVPVTMTALQAKLSKSIMSKNPLLLKAMFAKRKLSRSEKGSLNNLLMQLRKCLCHPFVYSTAIEERCHDETVLHKNLVHASAKLELLDIMLPKLKENGHRILIFSQFLRQLDIMEDYMNGMKYNYRRLDGSMSSLQKQQCIEAFNAADSPIFVMLLSTRAGGVGINLATADTVIVMDPDFNPHQDMQAFSRAHRIGQKRSVLCFQLMTKDTVEERIMQMGRGKMALDHALIETMDDEDLEADDLESILKHGAEALFNDDYQKTAIKYTSASVDKLLDRSDMVIAADPTTTTTEPQFPYGQVWDNSKSSLEDVDIVDEEPVDNDASRGFWDKILAQREEEAHREAELSQEVLGRGGRRRTDVNYNSTANDLDMDLLDDDTDSQDEFEDIPQQSESDDNMPEPQAKDATPGGESDEVQITSTRPIAGPAAETSQPAEIGSQTAQSVTQELAALPVQKTRGRKPFLPKRKYVSPQDEMAVVNMATRHALGKVSFRNRLNSAPSLPTQSTQSHPGRVWDPNVQPPEKGQRRNVSGPNVSQPVSSTFPAVPAAQQLASMTGLVPISTPRKSTIPGTMVLGARVSRPPPPKRNGMILLRSILTAMDPNSVAISQQFQLYLRTISTEADARIGIDIVGRHMRDGLLKTRWLARLNERLDVVVANRNDSGERVRRGAATPAAAIPAAATGDSGPRKASSPVIIELDSDTADSAGDLMLPKAPSPVIIDLEAEQSGT